MQFIIPSGLCRGEQVPGARANTHFLGENKKRLGEFNLLANEWQGLGKGGEVSG